MNGRIYDPLLGRFLSADLVVQYPGSLQSFNRYSYVRNNPLTSIDPSGFQDAAATASFSQFARDAAPVTPIVVTALVEGAPAAGAALTGGGIFVATVGGVAAGGYLLDAAPLSQSPVGVNPYAADALNISWAIRTVFYGETAPPPDHTRGYMTAMQSGNGQQAASNAATTPKEPAEQGSDAAKQKENSSGGQVPQEPPNDKDPKARGRESEKRVLSDIGEKKNTEKISTSEGDTIPDFQNKTQVGEIKDTKTVTNTPQIRAQKEAASTTGREHVIFTGKETKVTPKAAEGSTVVRREDLGPKQKKPGEP